MKRGEVWWADIPGFGRRPALILTRDSAIHVLASICIATVTQTERGVPSEVILDVDDGVPSRSVVNLDNLMTVSKRALRGRITELDPSRLDQVCDALRFATAC